MQTHWKCAKLPPRMLRSRTLLFFTFVFHLLPLCSPAHTEASKKLHDDLGDEKMRERRKNRMEIKRSQPCFNTEKINAATVSCFLNDSIVCESIISSAGIFLSRCWKYRAMINSSHNLFSIAPDTVVGLIAYSLVSNQERTQRINIVSEKT
jgi:hypothetical protein